MMYSPSGVDNTLRWTTKYQNLWKTEASLLRSQEPATVPYQMNPINTIQPIFLMSNLILSPFLRLCIPMVSFLRTFQP